MMSIRLPTLTLAATIVVYGLAAGQSRKPAVHAETGSPATRLPPAILAAFQTAYPKATIKNVAREKEDGKTVWEVESVENNLTRDIVFNVDGTVATMEEQAVEEASGKVGGQAPLPGADGPYKQLAEIRVGGEGGWDYLAVDSAARRLYVSHATKVVVIDMDANQVVGEIAPAPGVHGVAIAPELGRGFVSNGRENSASIFDLKTLQITGSVKTGENPDCILYEPGHKEVYAFNGRGRSATVFDATTGEVKATIPLPGKPEFAVLDGKAGRIFNNIEDTNEIVIIDTVSHTVTATWSIAPGEGASGLAIDLANHRLFAVAGNRLLIALDSDSGKVLSTLAIGPGVDAAAYDPGTGLGFASSSDGTLTVAKVDAAGKMSLAQTLATPPRSRTMTLDPRTHRIYISAADFTPPPPPVAGAQPQRPQMVPVSFRVVVYEMAEQPGR